MRVSQKMLMAGFTAQSPEVQMALVELMGIEVPVQTKPHYYTKAEMKAGGGYSCQVDSKCLKKTRSYERSTTHATTNAELKAYGHIAVR